MHWSGRGVSAPPPIAFAQYGSGTEVGLSFL
jgi:hypothetical protein